jgi:hypothetical protein
MSFNDSEGAIFERVFAEVYTSGNYEPLGIEQFKNAISVGMGLTELDEN